ncbi:hypothetical protein ACQ4LE_004036 [Meloidogyne hapla]|uniref:Pept_C1 domain-containing protein n=1 Tax=Meloidogyne hapla TaxID=6305 RepID=A0A1I8BXV8_MELHA
MKIFPIFSILLLLIYVDLTKAACRYITDFDSRNQWPRCKDIINRVVHQGGCDACWAVSTASAYTDRYCIERAKKGLSTPNNASYQFSALDILTCARPLFDGCQGAQMYIAWNYIHQHGVCTGADYPWGSGCRPYPYSPGVPAYRIKCNEFRQKPQCTNPKWKIPYANDKRGLRSVGRLHGPRSTVGAIQAEIRLNGPVTAGFLAYDDIDNRGPIDDVYIRVGKRKIFPNHGLVIVGWGRQICGSIVTPYWICKNSWGTGWGKQGFINVRLGTNECGIEKNDISFGVPAV